MSDAKTWNEIEVSPEWRAKWLGISETVPPGELGPKQDRVAWERDLRNLGETTERFVKSIVAGFISTPRKLVLSGRTGVGKSHVARAAVKAVREIGTTQWRLGKLHKMPVCCSLSWSDLAEHRRGDRSTQGFWDDASAADLVLIDDLGSETDRFRSGAPTENLRLIMELRRNKHTIFTTNLHPRKWTETWDFRVDDRLANRSSVVVCMAHAWSFSSRKAVAGTFSWKG